MGIQAEEFGKALTAYGRRVQRLIDERTVSLT